jgi:hypothetical protein
MKKFTVSNQLTQKCKTKKELLEKLFFKGNEIYIITKIYNEKDILNKSDNLFLKKKPLKNEDGKITIGLSDSDNKNSSLEFNREVNCYIYKLNVNLKHIKTIELENLSINSKFNPENHLFDTTSEIEQSYKENKDKFYMKTKDGKEIEFKGDILINDYENKTDDYSLQQYPNGWNNFNTKNSFICRSCRLWYEFSFNDNCRCGDKFEDNILKIRYEEVKSKSYEDERYFLTKYKIN